MHAAESDASDGSVSPTEEVTVGHSDNWKKDYEIPWLPSVLHLESWVYQRHIFICMLSG